MFNQGNTGIFAGFKNAQVFAAVPDPIPADFDGDVKIKRTLMKQTQRSGLAFIAELEVVTSNHPKHPCGSVLSYFQSTSDRVIAFNNLLAFLVAAAGEDRNDPAAVERVKQYAEQTFNEAVESPTKNNLIDRVLHVRGVGTITSKGHAFVAKIWTMATGKAGPSVQIAAPVQQPATPTPGAMPAPPWAQEQQQQAQQQAQGTPPWGVKKDEDLPF
jgi:hypothetical protein